MSKLNLHQIDEILFNYQLEEDDSDDGGKVLNDDVIENTSNITKD